MITIKYLDNTIKEFKSINDLLSDNNKLNIVELTICNMYITELPNNIGELKNLKKLALSYNDLKEIDDNIGELQKLEYLNLQNNKIIKISNSINKLINLKYLNISYNYITKFPKLTNLINLETLKISNNNFEYVELYPNYLIHEIKDIEYDALQFSIVFNYYISNKNIENKNIIIYQQNQKPKKHFSFDL
jgi:Leucine-rich repeat (LRR) protein